MANPGNGMNVNGYNSNATTATELNASMELSENEEEGEPLERSIPPEAVPVLPPPPPPSTGGRYRRKRSTRHKRKSHRRKSHRRKSHRRRTHRR